MGNKISTTLNLLWLRSKKATDKARADCLQKVCIGLTTKLRHYHNRLLLDGYVCCVRIYHRRCQRVLLFSSALILGNRPSYMVTTATTTATTSRNIA